MRKSNSKKLYTPITAIAFIFGSLFCVTIAAFLYFTISAPASISATSSGLNVGITNPMQTVATAKGYFVGIANNGAVNVTLDNTVHGIFGVSLNKLTVLTNAPSGYKLLLSSDQSEDYGENLPGNALYPTTDGGGTTDTTSKNHFNPTSSSYPTVAALDNNSWGFNIGAYNDGTVTPESPVTFAGVPLADDLVLIKETDTQDVTDDTENTQVNVYYGAKASTSMPSGTYVGKVLYTAFADAGTVSEATIIPSTTSNFAGGDSVRITTSLFSIGDPGEVTVSIGEPNTDGTDGANTNNCPVTAYDYNDEVLSVTCTLPEKPSLPTSYTVYVTIPKFDKSYTIVNGLTYEYVNKLTTITNMQEMTSTICNQTTTPAAFELNGTTINANVPQSTLYDVRDNKSYIVQKYADGHCWMGESLKLDGARTLTPDDTDITANVSYPNQTTITGGNTAQIPANAFQYMYYVNNDVYVYNWYATTAGAGTATLQNVDVLNSSICARGWRLPSYYEEHYQTLLDTYHIARESSTDAPNAPLLVAPFNYKYGSYWNGWYADRIMLTTSTAGPPDSRWPTSYYTNYMLGVFSPSRIQMDAWHKRDGQQIRCLSR